MYKRQVYDALATLTDKGIIRRIQPAKSPARYEGRVGDNHHHLICRICGRMVDADCAVGYAPCLTAPADSDYEIDEAEVIYWGRCPECVAAAAVVAVGLPREHATRENGRSGMPSRPRAPTASTRGQSSKVNH